MTLTGIGGQAKNTLTEAVQIPLQLQWCAQPVYIYAHVAHTPQDVDLLMGCDVLDFLRATVDRDAKRVIFPSAQLAVPLETIPDNLRRIASPAVSVLSTCSGCNFVFATMMNLGFPIQHWYSVETDTTCRAELS